MTNDEMTTYHMRSSQTAWKVMGAAFLASIAVAANQFKVPPLMQVLLGEFDIDLVTGGWLMSIFAVAGFILAIPAAFLLVRLGFQRTGLVALSFSITGAVLGALAPTAEILLVSRVIEGIGVGLIAVAAPAIISAWFEPRDRGLPMGIWAAWVPVGNVLIFNLAHPLQAALGWRAVWWFGASFSALALVVFGLIVTEPPRQRQEVPQPPSGTGSTMIQSLLNPSGWLLGLTFGTFSFSIISYNTWAPVYLSETMPVSEATASFYASLMFLAGIPGNVAGGWLVSRIRRRHALLSISFVLTGLILAFGFQLGREGVVVPYMVVLGFISNIIPACVFTLAPETMPRPELAGLSLAMVSVASNLGVLTGPPISGGVISRSGWTTASLSLLIVMSIGTVISLLVWKTMSSVAADATSPTAA